MTSNKQTFSHLPADITAALDEYDTEVADGKLTIDGGFAVISGPTHPEVWLPGNALNYFESTNGIS